MGAKMEDIEGYEPMTEVKSKIHHLKMIKESTGAIMESLVDRDLLLMRAPEGRTFYLSDNPVALYNSEPRNGIFGNLGFAVPGIQIYMPLSAELMLCAWCPSIMGQLKERHRQHKNDLAGAILSPRMMRGCEPDKMAAFIAQLRPLTRTIEDHIDNFEKGTPTLLTTVNMDFQNSLQVSNAREHVICRKGDFALAKRFMGDDLPLGSSLVAM